MKNGVFDLINLIDPTKVRMQSAEKKRRLTNEQFRLTKEYSLVLTP